MRGSDSAAVCRTAASRTLTSSSRAAALQGQRPSSRPAALVKARRPPLGRCACRVACCCWWPCRCTLQATWPRVSVPAVPSQTGKLLFATTLAGCMHQALMHHACAWQGRAMYALAVQQQVTEGATLVYACLCYAGMQGVHHARWSVMAAAACAARMATLTVASKWLCSQAAAAC